MRGIVAMIAAALMLTPLAGLAAQGGPLDWMVGNWHTETGVTPEVAERWRPIHDGVMTGVSRNFSDGKLTGTETMSIRFDGTVAVFRASPDGAPPVDFRETSRGEHEVVFENPAHDYPQRIRYWREGEFLMAEISLKDGSHAMRWKYRAIALD
ncbi:DUF6265 family protein [Sphingomonas sp. LB-2]|uniref:DUF6265 family protein n=1 Tax=Sphingomonas caeni TaxID=2984949 RepID=UPI002231755C|nr:DUF6265 family protein [Sphingomonas caeni]MCW3846100.1 DUF6265 family protein [Sphingomonas caeni]